MNEIIEKIITEIRDNIFIPGYDDKTIKDISAFALTVAFSLLQDICVNLVNKKTGDKKD
jgi:hypothetical protein